MVIGENSLLRMILNGPDVLEKGLFHWKKRMMNCLGSIFRV